jgi:transcriptional regulator with XRE-family HTH domain
MNEASVPAESAPPVSHRRRAHAIDVHIGKRILARRRGIGLSQKALGEQLGLTFQQVQKYERGANRVSAARLYTIAQVLECSVESFFEGLDTLDGKRSPSPPLVLVDDDFPRLASAYSGLPAFARAVIVEFVVSLAAGLATSATDPVERRSLQVLAQASR